MIVIWSLIFHLEQPLPKICPLTAMKIFYKKVPPCFFRGRHYALAPLENYVGVYASSIFARECRVKLVNTLDFAKRTVWQNRSVGWGIIYELEYCHLKPLRALHWDLTSSWSSFLCSSLNSNKTTVMNIKWFSLSTY